MTSGNIETQVYKLDAGHPDPQIIIRAAEVLHGGGLVAFPTETVYGLGANALDAAAVARIYEAKGRPSNNPIIVHVGSSDEAKRIALEWPKRAELLTQAFWPGPLTIVLRKSPDIPDIVTGGQETVAIRMPAHAIAAALLAACRLPIAAPSANCSMRVSPTRAEHVVKFLRGRIEMVLDSGATSVGIESTVVDLTGQKVVILRPGSIDRDQIQQVLGDELEVIAGSVSPGHATRSPGLQERHYAPKARVECAGGDLMGRARHHVQSGKRLGVLAMGSDKADSARLKNCVIVAMPEDHDAYASRLYAALHELDDAGVDIIFVEWPPETEAWRAIRDRLQRMTQ